MTFSTPIATILPVKLEDGQLMVALQMHDVDGKPTLKIITGDVDPVKDGSINQTVQRHMQSHFGSEVYGVVMDGGVETGRNLRQGGGAGSWGVTFHYIYFMPPAELSDHVGKDLIWIPKHDLLETVNNDDDVITLHGCEANFSTLFDIRSMIHQVENRCQSGTWPLFLLDREFSLSEMQRAYEATTSLTINPANFRRKVLSLNVLREIGERRDGAYRPTKTYSQSTPYIDLGRNLFHDNTGPLMPR